MKTIIQTLKRIWSIKMNLVIAIALWLVLVLREILIDMPAWIIVAGFLGFFLYWTFKIYHEFNLKE